MSHSKLAGASKKAFATISRSIHMPTTFKSAYGPTGRAANSGITATVFGGYGFLGSYVMNELGAIGSTVYAPFRGCELEVRHLKPMFDVGNLGLLPFSPRDEESIKPSIRRSQVVINTIGKFYETRHIVPTRRADGSISRVNFGFEEVNVEIPRRLARMSKEAGAKVFIHLSSMSANPNSSSEWSRTKYAGELAVREEFPEAIIIRPATIFGTEDKFLNDIAKKITQSREFFLVNGGKNSVQPVHVVDISEAILQIIRRHEEFAGKTFTLAGPAEYTYKEVVEFVADIVNHPLDMYEVPASLANVFAKFVGKFPNPMFTTDSIARITEDNVMSPDVVKDTLTFDDLKMSPSSMDRIAFDYLYAYRPGGHFNIVSGYH